MKNILFRPFPLLFVTFAISLTLVDSTRKIKSFFSFFFLSLRADCCFVYLSTKFTYQQKREREKERRKKIRSGAGDKRDFNGESSVAHISLFTDVAAAKSSCFFWQID